MAKHHINAALVVTGLMLVAIPAAQASKVTRLYTPDAFPGGFDQRNCTFYLTNDIGWVGVDMTAPNSAKLSSDLTFWATLGSAVDIATYNGTACGKTVGAAAVNLPLTGQ